MFKRDRGKGVPRNNQVNAVLGDGTEFEGKLIFQGMVRLDGKFKGDISASDTLVVGETARIEARISADVVIISGTVRGNVEAKSRLEIHKPGALYGDVTTKSLIVDEGAILNGMCRMGEEKKAGEVQTLTFRPNKTSPPEAKDSTSNPPGAS